MVFYVSRVWVYASLRKMNILVLGSGGREHALTYRIAQSPHATRVFIAPGNPGTLRLGTNLPVEPMDFNAIGAAVRKHAIQMVVCGPEEPLVKGIADFFASDPDLQHVLFVGPSQQGAQLEGSKAFAKAFMQRHGIPTAAYRVFDSEQLEEAKHYVRQHPFPVVVKADGLAAGKGVSVCFTEEEANEALTELMERRRFGAACKKIVIEQFLQGKEMSVFVLTDGVHYVLLPTAKDYKRLGEGDTGPNTGGMGALSPAPGTSKQLLATIEDRIVKPTLAGLRKEGISYKGFLYLGLMIVQDDPYVIEYNCRLGDPEAQVVLPRLKGDVVPLFAAACTQKLKELVPGELPYHAVGIVLAAKGYPQKPESGKVINNLSLTSQCLVFHAGTRQRIGGEIETAGGRILTVVAFHRSWREARAIALRNAQLIQFEGKYFRSDIGHEVLNQD